MKKEKKQSFVKHMAIGIFTMLFVIVGACLISPNGSEVLAADSYTDDSYSGSVVKSQYWGEKAPAPKETKYVGWIFAGWLNSEGNIVTSIDENATYYAKFVDPEVLQVKTQVTKNTTESSESTNMRLISSVDCLFYREVGFEIYYNGEYEDTFSIDTVYERILAGSSSQSGVAFNYSPKIIDTESEYFMTYTLLNIDGDNFDKYFQIRPYWKTADYVKVYGVTRYVKVSDSYSGVTNIPVYTTTDVTSNYSAATVAITTGGEAVSSGTASATVDECKYDDTTKWANLRVKLTGATALPSASTITATVGENTYRTIYRNTEVVYTGTAKKYAAGDQTWYTEYILNNPSETEFVVATASELYGLPDLVNNTESGITFSGKTIYVVADIDCNNNYKVTQYTSSENRPSMSDDDTTDSNTYTDYRWNPIGNSTTKFQGKFNGQGHTISGLYINSDPQYCGLFGYTESAEISDFNLINSVFRTSLTTGAYTGGVVAYGSGTLLMSDVYTDASVCAYTYIGGLVGNMSGSQTTSEVRIQNCHYDGYVFTRATSGNVRSGGIVGYAPKGTFLVENVLFTGTIRISGGNRLGGFFGDTNNRSTSPIDITDCVSAGTITLINSNTSSAYIGSVVGRSNTGSVKLNNVYATRECYAVTHDATTSANDCLAANSQVSVINNNQSLYGLGAYHWTNLDFENDWSLREGDIVVPKAFAESDYDVAGDIEADITWYTEAASDATTYDIADAADLYGLAILVNAGNTFAGKTIKLTADIDLNEGWENTFHIIESTNSPSTVSVPTNEWIPIGTADNPFKGTFEGNNNTISGLYIYKTVLDGNGAGLFGNTYNVDDDLQMCTIQNFALTNSHIGLKNVNAEATSTGSIVGTGEAEIQNVYSDATMYLVTSGYVGGMIGVIDNGSGTTHCTISNSWFDGLIVSRSDNALQINSGGFVGYTKYGAANAIENCLFTGIINYKSGSDAESITPRIGGFIGRYNSGVKTLISDSLSAGTITTVSAREDATFTQVASIVGTERASSTTSSSLIAISDVYDVGYSSDLPAVVNKNANEITSFPVTLNADETETTSISSLASWDYSNVLNLDTAYWQLGQNSHTMVVIPLLSDLLDHNYTDKWVLP